MASVGLSPRHNVSGPSFLAILRMPSSVELNVFEFASSTAQATPSLFTMVELGGPATQYAALLLTQKTSLQHDDIPRLGGRLENWVGRVGVRDIEVCG